MAREVVRIDDLRPRMPEQGRIRIGKKTKTERGERPDKISEFRFTSHDEAAIRAIADLYGGTPRPWSEGPRSAEWEVFTKARELPIALPPEPFSRWYELWSAGGIQRRCDGEVCSTPQATAEGAEMAQVDCLCRAKNLMVCKPTIRLNVVLRDVRFGGSWRLESHGWTAFSTLPGMVQMIELLQGRGIIDGLLLLREHTTKTKVRCSKCGGAGCKSCDGTGETVRTNRYMVPALAVENTVAEIAAGAASLGALAPAPQAALPAPQTAVDEVPPAPLSIDDGAGWDGASDDEDIADAEVVDEGSGDPHGAAATPQEEAEGQPSGRAEPSPSATTDGPVPSSTSTPSEHHAKMLRKMHALITHVRAKCDATKTVDEWRHALVLTATRGRVRSSADLDDAELGVLLDLLDDLNEGRRRYICIDTMSGKVRMSQRAEATA